MVEVSNGFGIKPVLSRSRPEPVHLRAGCSSICSSHAACQTCVLFAVRRAVDDHHRGCRLSSHTFNVALFVGSGFMGSVGFLHLVLPLGWLHNLVTVLCLLWLGDLWLLWFVLCLLWLHMGLRRCRLTFPSRFQLSGTRSRF